MTKKGKYYDLGNHHRNLINMSVHNHLIIKGTQQKKQNHYATSNSEEKTCKSSVRFQEAGTLNVLLVEIAHIPNFLESQTGSLQRYTEQ